MTLLRRTALKRRTRIRAMSDKRRKASRKYSVLRKQFLTGAPFCEVPDCISRSCDVHHARGRTGTNYLDVKTWLAVCRTHHDQIHQHPNWARTEGLLA